MSENEEFQAVDNIYYLINKSNNLNQKPEDIDASIEVLDMIPEIGLIKLQTSPEKLQDILANENFQLIDEKIVCKIEPLIFQEIKGEDACQENIVSVLIDVEDYTLEAIDELEKVNGLEIKKELPFLSSVYATFPAEKLLDIATLKFVNTISDSKGQIVMDGGSNE